MIDSQHDSLYLMQKEANPSVIEYLYAHGFINSQAKDFALDLIASPKQWGYWAAKIFSILGVSLLISGMAFFLVYNWEYMTFRHKFVTIEVTLLCTLMGAWTYSLSRLLGKLFLTASCVLVGAFLIVYGQIYQTGANAFELFLAWSIIITPWVILGQFMPLYLLWIGLINTALFLFHYEVMALNTDLGYLIHYSMILINIIFLALKEYLSHLNLLWAKQRWARIILAFVLIFISLIPIESMILNPDWHNTTLVASFLIGAFVHISLFIVYRKMIIDMGVFALTILSTCLIASTFAYKLLIEIPMAEAMQWFFISLSTLVIFSLGAFILRATLPRAIGNEYAAL